VGARIHRQFPRVLTDGLGRSRYEAQAAATPMNNATAHASSTAVQISDKMPITMGFLLEWRAILGAIGVLQQFAFPLS
jgi:hypothetical protein